MSETVVLELPEDTLQRYRQGAVVAHKRLEEFLAERLSDAPLPLAEDLPPPFGQELAALGRLDDDALWEVARRRLPTGKQQMYELLSEKHREGTISPVERQTLRALGEEARRLTLEKAHAFMILKWRGHDVPSPDQMLDLE